MDCIYGLSRSAGFVVLVRFGATYLLAWFQGSLHEIVGEALLIGRKLLRYEYKQQPAWIARYEGMRVLAFTFRSWYGGLA